MTYSQEPAQQPQWGQQQAIQNNNATSKLKLSSEGQTVALGIFGVAAFMFFLRFANWYVFKVADGSEEGKIGLRGNGTLKINFTDDGDSYKVGLDILSFTGHYSFAAVLAVLVAAALSLSPLYRRPAFITTAVAVATFILLPTLQFLVLLIGVPNDDDFKFRPGFGLILMWILLVAAIAVAVWLQTLTNQANQQQPQFSYAPQGQNGAWGQSEQHAPQSAQNSWQQPQPEPQSQSEQTTASESPATENKAAPEDSHNPWAELDEDPKDSDNRNPWA